tara:strand:+ start:7407 stop:8021 length:615 start_codon:yes stop_codon:yes gene_type:complete
MSEIIKKLAEVQAVLNAPKGQFNNFGKYSYRNCEDILQAVKPLLGTAVILLSDDIKVHADRVYVEATAKFCYEGETIEVKALAREAQNKKGMDDAQITGSASSYARKYALNGLLLIDDNKDPDSRDNSKQEIPHPNSKVGKAVKQKTRESHPVVPVIAGYLADPSQHDLAREALKEITSEEEKMEIWKLFTVQEKEIIKTLKVM